MPFRKVNLTEGDVKLIRRLARYGKTGEASILRSLVNMSLEKIRSEERAGWYYGDMPKELRSPPSRKIRVVSKYDGWTKEQRDAWILYGTLPGDDGVINRSLSNNAVFHETYHSLVSYQS